MAAIFREVWVINAYAASGTTMKQESYRFFNSQLPYLLTGVSGHILLGGDCNCMLEASDATGGLNYSRALAELVQGLALTDTWQGNSHGNFTPTIPCLEQLGLTEFMPHRTCSRENCVLGPSWHRLVITSPFVYV